ncbi:MAG TPA: cation:proton antiporter [Tepidisphaeraceae bacterium]|jgi:Kef-type K+ transport system membrane component KefB
MAALSVAKFFAIELLPGVELPRVVTHVVEHQVSHAIESELLLLLVQVALILGLSRVMGILFARMRQPQVVGEMVAGIMLGPSVLGALSQHFHSNIQQRLFPPGPSLELLNILSELGVIFFLFLVGLEFEMDLVKNRGRSTVFTALSSIAVPFALGMGVALFLESRGLFGDVPRLPAALFVGAAMSVTAFPVLARILTERNLQKTKLGVATIAAAAINDVAAWVILAFVVAVAHTAAQASSGSSHGKWDALRTIGLAAGFGTVMFAFVRPFLKRLELIYQRQGRLSQNVIAVLFLLILGCAWSTERIGIHAMFGAFLLGVVMPKGTQFVRHVTEKIEDFTVVFLLPIFFAYTGLKTQLGLLNEPVLWMYAALIVATACLGKFGGAAVVAKAFGATWRESSAIGILMNTRGLVELVILTVGLQFGVINDKVFAMMVIMALVTTFMTTPLLHWVYPAHLLQDEMRRAAAAGQPREAKKPYTVLLPVAAPRSGGPLLRLADLITGPGSTDRRIYALHLRRPVDRSEFRSGLREEQQAAADETVRSLMAHAENHHIPVELVSFVSHHVARDIVRVAGERQADLVLIGYHQPVFGRSLLGGTVGRILETAPTNVAVLIDRGFLGAQRVLVPFLGGRHDRLAMQLAGRFAAHANAQVTILHVTAPKGGEPPLNAKEAVDRVFNDPSQPLPVQFRVIESADPVGTVIEQSADFDLVVIGVSEEWGLESQRFGFRRERIAAGTPASLLIVRENVPSAADATGPARPVHVDAQPAGVT